VDRTQFEALRNLDGKFIDDDIRFVKSKPMSPLMIAENIRIKNDSGVDVRLTIHYNPAIRSKTFNVHIPGIGPICRLDVDGPPHRPAGRCHKHSLQTARCPERNLPDKVSDLPTLSGKSVRELFAEFCNMACIQHNGELETPDEDDLGAVVT